MSGINRRKMLQAIGASSAAMAATVLAGPSAFAAFSTPTRGLQYQTFSGEDFKPQSLINSGVLSSWTYNDNGSIYRSGGDSGFRTRIQLPQGSVITEVQFSYFLNDASSMAFLLLAFDGQNGFAVPFQGTAGGAAANIQTITLSGSPTLVDNRTWNYLLHWRPGSSGPTQILWGARVGYRSHEGEG